MTYDNTKLRRAMYAWLHARCDEGFGEVYGGDLLDDFVDFLDETHMLRASPGRVVFGRELALLDFEKRKAAGLTFWSGILLKKQTWHHVLSTHQYAMSLAKRHREDKERKVNEAKRKARYRKDLSEFHARMKIEDAKREQMMKEDDRWQEK